MGLPRLKTIPALSALFVISFAWGKDYVPQRDIPGGESCLLKNGNFNFRLCKLSK